MPMTRTSISGLDALIGVMERRPSSQKGYGWCIYAVRHGELAYISLQAYFNAQSVSDTGFYYFLNLRPMIPWVPYLPQ